MNTDFPCLLRLSFFSNIQSLLFLILFPLAFFILSLNRKKISEDVDVKHEAAIRNQSKSNTFLIYWLSNISAVNSIWLKWSIQEWFYHKMDIKTVNSNVQNEEQKITGYHIDDDMGSSGGRQIRKLSVVCLHNNIIVARGILVTILHWDTRTPAPSIMLVLL